MNKKPILDMIRPSGSHEWYYCHGAQVMQQGKPDANDEDTLEGQACHWVAEQILIPYTVFSGTLKTSNDFVDKPAPNGVIVDKEMYQAALMYVMEILSYCNLTGLIRFVKVEQKLLLDIIYDGMSGTPDAWVYNASAAELIIWDLKYGFGHVDEYENPQLMIYIAGILKLLNIDGIADEMLTVKMVIVQPRSYHGKSSVRTWTVKASELRPYFNKLRDAAYQAMSSQGLCTPGLHCRHCKGRNDCSAITKTLYNYIDIVVGPVPMELQGNNLVLEWQLLNRIEKLLEYRKSAIDGQIEATINAGERLPGILLEQQYGRERWKKGTPVEKVLAMAKMYGADIARPQQLDTPNQSLVKIKQAAKEFKVKVDKSLIQGWIETPFKGFKIVEDDGVEVNRVFKKGPRNV